MAEAILSIRNNHDYNQAVRQLHSLEDAEPGTSRFEEKVRLEALIDEYDNDTPHDE